MGTRPLLVVGDVQGDVERLREALIPYPEDEVDTLFLGDFFQGAAPGSGGGVAAARLARERRNAAAVLGNHDLVILCVLQQHRDGWRPPPPALPDVVLPHVARVITEQLTDFWRARRGDDADLAALAADPGLEQWLRSLPLLVLCDDGTLAQHNDGTTMRQLGATVAGVNDRVRKLLETADGTWEVFWHTLQRRAFTDRAVLEQYLAHFGARRVVHGHTPHRQDRPLAIHDGQAWAFDGCFSRYWARDDGATVGPIEATVGLLPALD